MARCNIFLASRDLGRSARNRLAPDGAARHPPVRVRSPGPCPGRGTTPTADDPEPSPAAAGRPAQRTLGGGFRPGRKPGDIRGAGLTVAAGPFRSPVRVRIAGPPSPGRGTTSDSRQPGAAPRRGRQACAANSRRRLPPRAEAGGHSRSRPDGGGGAVPARRDLRSPVPCAPGPQLRAIPAGTAAPRPVRTPPPRRTDRPRPRPAPPPATRTRPPPGCR